MWGACSLSRGLSDGDAHTGRPGATKRLLIWARVASIPAGRPSRAPGRLCSVRTPTCCLLPLLLRSRGGRARRDARCGPILFPPTPAASRVRAASKRPEESDTYGRARGQGVRGAPRLRGHGRMGRAAGAGRTRVPPSSRPGRRPRTTSRGRARPALSAGRVGDWAFNSLPDLGGRQAPLAFLVFPLLVVIDRSERDPAGPRNLGSTVHRCASLGVATRIGGRPG